MRQLFTRDFYNKKRFNRWLLKALLLIFFLPVSGWSQFYDGYQMDFGRSRVQFDNFLWTFYKFDRFDVYFYLNGKELAEHTSRYVSGELTTMENRLGTHLDLKIQFLIFNNLNDLKQSNIGLNADVNYNVGGVSYILGNKVVLYFDGSLINFEKQIRQGLAHVLLQNAIFGGNITSQILNSFLKNTPEWYSRGLISYLAEEWNTDIDDKIRNIILSGKFRKFSQLVMDENKVVDAGHSFWKFVADVYGKENITEIINMTRVSRSVENGFMYALGVSLKTLYKDWYSHYYAKYSNEQERFDPLPENSQITGRRVLKNNSVLRDYSQIESSASGENIAFVTNETGKFHVWLLNTSRNKLKRLYTGGFRLDEKVDFSYPLLSWHPSGKILSMIIENKGMIQLYFYDLDERKWTHRNLFGFEKVLDFSYSDNGQLLLLSAVQEGQSDIFTFNLISGSYERITNDIFDDLNPRFLENSTKIIFSSNRISDTLTEINSLPADLPQHYDVFVYSYSNKDPLLRRITDTPVANELQPMPFGNNYVAYLSNESGINNQYIGLPDSVVAYIDTAVHYRFFTHSAALTNFPANISSHHISPEAETNVFIVNDKMFDKLYREELTINEPLETVKPETSDFVRSMTGENVALPSTVKPEIPVIAPGENEQPASRQRKSFRNVMRDDTSEVPAESDLPETDDQIDIDTYKFDQQGIIRINMPDSAQLLIDRSRKLSDSAKSDFILPVQRNYYTEYFINELVTQVDFSYLNQTYQPFSSVDNPGFSYPGLSPTFKIGLTDLMEDYRIMGGMRVGLDFVNKEFFFNFSNLKGRLDKEFVFQYRHIEDVIQSAFVFRQKVLEGFYILTYPLNRVLRLKNTFLVRNENYIIAGPDELILKEPNVRQIWGGDKIQLIYDDSRELGLNLPHGTKFMLFGEYNQMVDDPAHNLLVLGFDFRSYARLHRQFIWANRLAGSTNFGKDRLMYFMGGTDGWISPKFDRETRIDPSMNWAYQTLATNLRGFGQNARNGNNFIVLNSEFRFPVFTYLLNRPISSEFVKNFQVVAFGDLGTAWAGWNPYDKDNVLYTKYETYGPLRIKVQYEKDPIIGGIGFGARTKIFGYFMKGDFAWGIEDGKIKKEPIFYLSLNLDF